MHFNFGIYWWVLLGSALLAGAFYVLIRIRLPRAVFPSPIDYSKPPLREAYVLVEFQDEPKFNRDPPELSFQSLEWQSGMQSCGKRLEESRVRIVYFVHGTFVGNDPTGLIALLRSAVPILPAKLERSLLHLAKKPTDVIAKDLGNYLPAYVELFQDALGVDALEVRNFTWSSGNHHMARLAGAIEIANDLYQRQMELKLGPMDHVLLHGHSHAGQLFALLTHLLPRNALAAPIGPVLASLGYDLQHLRQVLNHISRLNLDFVTFGTPPRYRWRLLAQHRLLHFINHRGNSPKGGSLFGILHTRDGDYIQQLGISGTDLTASSKAERQANRVLDQILGVGFDWNLWKENIRYKLRLHEDGLNLLVDYKDQAGALPNCFKTFFGHGRYTRYDAMLFNTKKIVEHFY